jgi:hypothetical protein
MRITKHKRPRSRSVLDRAAHESIRHNVSWRTSDNRQLSWAEIGDRHLWNIVRLLTRRVRERRADAASCLREATHTDDCGPYALAHRRELSRRAAICSRRAQLSQGALYDAIDELDYRGLLPTLRELERACERLGTPVPRTWLEAWPEWLDLEDAGAYARSLRERADEANEARIAGWGRG